MFSEFVGISSSLSQVALHTGHNSGKEYILRFLKASPFKKPQCVFIFSVSDKYVEGLVEDLYRSQSAIRMIIKDHVSDLKNVFRTREWLATKPMIVNIDMEGDPKEIDKELLKKGGVYQLEVIGGNHRMEAIQQLLRDYDTPEEVLKSIQRYPMRVYLGLSHAQKVTLAFWDNLVEEHKTKMNFDEVAILFREEMCNVFGLEAADPVPKITNSLKDVKSVAWRERIRKLLGCRVSNLTLGRLCNHRK